ncbi:MAG: hypothetical protein ACXAEX_11205 [Promethearchaeota archaeon]|jgi:hypothetical protein
MGEVVLNHLAKIAEESTNEQSFTWAIVHDILLRFEGEDDLLHEDVVMASGEAMVFAYSPYHYGPMYMSIEGSPKRLRDMFGYFTNWIRGPTIGGDLEEAWEFIKKNINEGHGIHAEGLESFLIYGYIDSGDKKDRVIKCIAKWGPGLDGNITWEQFSKYPALFSFSSIKKSVIPKSDNENLKLIIETMVERQSAHPGLNRQLKVHPEVEIEDMKGKVIITGPENFGLKGFKSFIRDIQNGKLMRGMLQAYLDCHAINFHIWGRQWQSKWFKNQSKITKGDLAKLLSEAGDAYLEVASKLEEFSESKIKEGEFQEKLKIAIPLLKEAYDLEQKAIDTLIKISRILN